MVHDDGNVGFAVGAFDRTRTLVIDPTLAYSTFLGSIGADYGQGIAVDYMGNAHVAGGTSSPGFPTTSVVPDTSFNGFPIDGFVTKLNRDGSAVLYSTFLGGSTRDDADSVAIDLRGNAYVRGITQSSNIPTTPGAFDATFNAASTATWSS